MKFSHLALRRRQLDRQIHESPTSRPTGGWIKAVRESLGLSLEVFGERMDVTRATAHQMERAEVNESISVKRLRVAADALECELQIRFVPREPLEQIVYRRAIEVATRDVDRVNHSMLLEGQAIYDADRKDLICQLAESLIEENDRRLWISD
jgi:predicted DNA-binding mobile mystery protein A